MLACGEYFAAALKSNNTVAFAGTGEDPEGVDLTAMGLAAVAWTDVRSIAACWSALFAVHSDGTVSALGGGFSDPSIIGTVTGWTNIVQISSYSDFVLGLKRDGTVVIAGTDTSGEVAGVATWTGIVSLHNNDEVTFGLKADGTFMVTGFDDYSVVTEVAAWTGMLSISGTSWHALGVKDDLSVLVAGDMNTGEEALVTTWTDITAVADLPNRSYGRKTDGTLEAVGLANVDLIDVPLTWTGITEVSGGYGFTVAVKSDGTAECSGGQGSEDIETAVALWSGLAHDQLYSDELTLPAMVVASVAEVTPTLRGELELPSFTLSGEVSGGLSASISIPMMLVEAEAVSGRTLAGDITLPTYVALGSINVARIANAELVLPTLQGTGVLTTGLVIQGELSLPSLSASGEILSTIELEAVLELPAFICYGSASSDAEQQYEVTALNNKTLAASSFSNFQFVDAVSTRGVTLLANAEGLFELGGVDDNATAVATKVKLPALKLNDGRHFHIRAIHVEGSGSSVTVTATFDTGASFTGIITQDNLELSDGRLSGNRDKLGREVTITLESSKHFQLDSVEAFIVRNRR